MGNSDETYTDRASLIKSTSMMNWSAISYYHAITHLSLLLQEEWAVSIFLINTLSFQYVQFNQIIYITLSIFQRMFQYPDIFF